MIYIPWHFPLHEDPNISGASEKAENVFKEAYPAVYQHLSEFKNELSNRNQAETGVRYEWYALQRWGANYWQDFFRQKIMYPNMTKFLPFYLDSLGYMQNDKSFMITGKYLGYLTAFLNSSLFKYCFINDFPELQGGTREIRKIFFDKIPVKPVDDKTEKEFLVIVTQIQEKKQKNERTLELELEVDAMIFRLYEFTINEIDEIGYINIE